MDLRTDLLAHADEALAWLTDAGLRDLGSGRAGQADPGFAADLQLARDVRASLRAMIAHNTDVSGLPKPTCGPWRRSRAKPSRGWR